MNYAIYDTYTEDHMITTFHTRKLLLRMRATKIKKSCHLKIFLYSLLLLIFVVIITCAV